MNLFTIWELLFSLWRQRLGSLPEESSSLGVTDTSGTGHTPSSGILILAFEHLVTALVYEYLTPRATFLRLWLSDASVRQSSLLWPP